MRRKRGAAGLWLALALTAACLGGCGSGTNQADKADARPDREAGASDAERPGALPDEGFPRSGAQVIAIPDENIPLSGEETAAVLTPNAPGIDVYANNSAVIDYSNAADGYICVSWTGGGSPKLKTLVNGPGGTSYQYNLRTDGEYDVFPLSDGDGAYTVGVYKNASGTQYATVLTGTVEARLRNEFAPFLRPNQYVFFTAESQAVKTAAAVCAGASGNLDKVERVYTFVVESLTYDREKARTVTSGYLPDVDAALASGKGICFDYASLMAAMLRSQGVPVKLVVGYTGEAYHAWLNVWSETDGWVDGKIYFNGKEWKLMDPTFASSGNRSDTIMEYIGDGSNYTAKYLY